MTTLSLPSLTARRADAPHLKLWSANRPLVLAGLGSAILLAATVVLAMVDTRLITGAPAWFKPMKFAVSTVIYTLTLAWMLNFVKGHPRLKAVIGWVTAVGFAIELALLVVQVVRGVRSHFNLTTPFDAAVFSTMGMVIILVWLVNLLTTLLILRQKFEDSAFAWSLRFGLLASSAGMLVAYLMTGTPSAAQRAQMEAGGAPQFFGAHSVGVEDGGAGLPFLGWSTEGGDLRVPHFIGLHGLQALPLAGLAVNRGFGRLNSKRRAALVWVAGLAYLGLIGLLTWQALRGQSIIAPDALTLAALGGLVLATAGAAGAVAGTAPKGQEAGRG